MKKVNLILCALCVFAITSCDEDETSYSVTPELQGYVESFYQEAALRGKDLPKNNLIASLNSDCQGITQIKKDDEQWILEFDKKVFDSFSSAGNPNNKIESFVFHELGKIVLKREIINTFPVPHDSLPKSIMNPYYKVEGYTAKQRTALLDELFK